MKKEFRKKVINNRKNITQNLLSKNSSIITEKLLSLECIRNAHTIMLYLDFNDEVQTNKLIKKLLYLNKIVVSPVTITDKKELIPYKITNLEEGLVIGAYGIREPKKDISNKINPKDIDIVIVPAVAFDRQCYRLGYGGGFYDRFIKTLRKDCITIGIAFDLQIFDSIPKAPHDAQLDYIITEKRILTSSK